MHVDGAFHSDFGLGTVARVVRRRSALATTILTAVPVDTLATADASAHVARADFVIFTRTSPAASAAHASPKP